MNRWVQLPWWSGCMISDPVFHTRSYWKSLYKSVEFYADFMRLCQCQYLTIWIWLCWFVGNLFFWFVARVIAAWIWEFLILSDGTVPLAIEPLDPLVTIWHTGFICLISVFVCLSQCIFCQWVKSFKWVKWVKRVKRKQSDTNKRMTKKKSAVKRKKKAQMKQIIKKKEQHDKWLSPKRTSASLKRKSAIERKGPVKRPVSRSQELTFYIGLFPFVRALSF